jgi:hypothetical protein
VTFRDSNARRTSSSRRSTQPQTLRSAITSSLVSSGIRLTSNVGNIFERLQAFLVPTNQLDIQDLIGLLNETNAISAKERIWLKTQLEQQRWLSQATIYVPSATGDPDALPDAQMAHLMLTSPIGVRFASATEIIQGILQYYPVLRNVLPRPDSLVAWSVADHRTAEEAWLRQSSVWNDWLQVLAESGLGPKYNEDNPDMVTALTLDGGNNLQLPGNNQIAPELVLLWFLKQYGNFRLATVQGEAYRYVEALESIGWNETAMYGMCHSLDGLKNSLRYGVKRRVSLDDVLYQLIHVGSEQDAFDRVLSLGYSLKMLSIVNLALLYLHALNCANFAGMNLIGSVYDPFPAKRNIEDDLRFLVLIRRDMWPYVAPHLSPEWFRQLRMQAKDQLGYNQE